MQVLGRTLEGLVNRAEELKRKWKDEFVSVEELVAAFAGDERLQRKSMERGGGGGVSSAPQRGRR
jgi:ATP-dependent Clp protease ATP-binding subunit ClpB